jgi:hypothetical protein
VGVEVDAGRELARIAVISRPIGPFGNFRAAANHATLAVTDTAATVPQPRRRLMP